MDDMEKWQYGELIFRVDGQHTWHDESGQDRPPGTNAVDSLNKLGQKGWQVVSVSDSDKAIRYVLSRRVE